MQPPDSLASRIQAWLREWGILTLLILVLFVSDVGSGLPLWLRIGIVTGYSVLTNMMAYPVTAIGTKHRVDANPVGEDENVRCDVCGRHIEDTAGEHRQYAEQQVAFGIPIRTTRWGENVYCTACESPVSDGARQGQRSSTAQPPNDDPSEFQLDDRHEQSRSKESE